MVKNKKPTGAPEMPSNNDAKELMKDLKKSIESCKTLNGLGELSQKIKESTLEKEQKEKLQKLIIEKQEAIKQLEKEGEKAVASLANSIKATADPASPSQGAWALPEAPKNWDSSTAGNVATVAETVVWTAIAGVLGRNLFKRIKKWRKWGEKQEEEQQQETQPKDKNKPWFRWRFGEIAGVIWWAVAWWLWLKYLYDHTEITRKTVDWAKDKWSAVWNWCKEQLWGWRDRIKNKWSSVLDWCTEKLWEWRWRIKEAIWLENWKPLDFNEAIDHISSEVTNGLNDNGESFNRNFNGIEYNEDTHTITSYGESTEIDKEKKIIKGMPEPKFGDYAELIFAANTVNFLKSIGKGRWWNNTPFSLWEWEDDIQFTFSDGTQGDILSHDDNLFFKKVAWATGGATIGWLIWGYLGNIKWIAAGSISWWLAWYAAVDRLCKSPLWRFAKTISSWSNLILFKNYLNKLTYPDDQTKSLWEAKEWSSDEVLDCPLKDDFIAVVTDIEKKWGKENTAQRAPKIEIEGDTYYISAYWQKIELTWIKYEQNKPIDYKNINNLSLWKYNDKDWGDGLDLKFSNTQAGVQECIRVALMTNYIRYNYNHRGAEPYPFRFWVAIDRSWSNAFDIDTDWLWTNKFWWTNIFYKAFLEEKCPTLYEDLKKYPATLVSASGSFWWIPWLDNQDDRNSKFHDDAINDQNNNTGSLYIKYLNQMCGSESTYRGWKQAA